MPPRDRHQVERPSTAAVQFVPMETSEGPLSPEQLLDAAQKRLSGKMKLDETGGKYVAIFYDPKLSGEATRRPGIRQPPHPEGSLFLPSS